MKFEAPGETMSKTLYRVGKVVSRDAATGKFSSVMKQSGASGREVVTVSKEAYDKGRAAASSTLSGKREVSGSSKR